jgi:hypothetical protein
MLHRNLQHGGGTKCVQLFPCPGVAEVRVLCLFPAVRGRVFTEGGFVLIHAAMTANPDAVEVVDSGCAAIYALAGDPGWSSVLSVFFLQSASPSVFVRGCLDTRAPLFQAGALDDVVAALLRFPDDKLLQNNGILALGWLAGEPSKAGIH